VVAEKESDIILGFLKYKRECIFLSVVYCNTLLEMFHFKVISLFMKENELVVMFRRSLPFSEKFFTKKVM